MKFVKSFRPSTLLIAAVTAITLSSCNRGVGCPTNFSLDSAAVDALQQVVATVLVAM